MGRMPEAEVAIDAALVHALLAEQHPDLAHLPLHVVAEGFDNVVVRLGDHLAVRLPRRAMAADLVRNEQRWLPDLATRLPLPVPVPTRIGVPGLGFPWCWSIVPWIPGQMAATTPLEDPVATAETLGAFLAQLHEPAPPGAPRNPYRGVPLAERDALVRQRITSLADVLLDRTDAVVSRWEQALAAPAWSAPPVWVHGDLHPANLLVRDGRLAAVIDFGDLTAGDPATDISIAWMLLPPAAWPAFRVAAGRTTAGVAADPALWTRAQGNALAHALACLDSSADNAVIHRIGEITLAAILDTPPDDAIRVA